MKLLLTSAGLSNETLRNTFLGLLKGKVHRSKVAFISTASNVEGDRSYVQEDIENLQRTGIREIDDIDISRLGDKDRWLEVLKRTNVVWVEGGNTFYLLKWFRESGLNKSIGDILKDKVYVGVSAGSVIAGPSIELAGWKPAGDKNVANLKDLTGLNLVDFEIFPHFELSHKILLEKYTKYVGYPIYILDNSMAVLVEGDKISLVGEGQGFRI